MKNRWLASGLAVFAALGLAAAVQAQKATPYPSAAPAREYLMGSADEEIAFARTAAPPSISKDAEVLVLGLHGYESRVKGTNGFVCFVERSWTGGFHDAEFWNPKIRAPNCFNPPAVRSVLPQYLKRAEWAFAANTREQMIRKAADAFAARQFTPPDPGSFSFMLSKLSFLGDEAGGPWYPHVMFFVPHGQAAAWGAGLEGSPVLGGEGDPSEPTVLYIPVRRWSDGSPAPSPGGQHQH